MKRYKRIKGRIIFSYSLTNAWCLPLCYTAVSESGEVEYQDGENEAENIVIDRSEVEKIKKAIERHPEIFEYKEVEDPVGVYDAVMNFFEFSNSEGRENRILAFNIDKVKNPDMTFFLPLREQDTSEKYVEPIRAREVVNTFEEIATVLIANGVDPDCLRLVYGKNGP